MKGFAALTILAVPCVAEVAGGSTKVNDPEHIQRLNSEPGSTWVAGHQDFFEGLTFEDARMFLGTRLSHISKHLNDTLHESVYAAISDEQVPTDFDSHKKWPGLIHPIRDQQQCGSCWAFSASEVLSDRVAIASGKASPVLSPEDMVSCDRVDQGCNGGSLPDAWKYLTTTGIVTDSCMPYKAGGGHAPKCNEQCVDSEAFARTKAKSGYAIHGAPNMQKDIMMHGPIQVGFMVYKSFMSYSKGVYHKHRQEKSPEGGHAVKIVGWGKGGKHAGTEYWLVANSWGTSWGEEGFFRILRGKNACGLEKMGPPYAGLAEVAAEDLIVV